MQISQDIQDVSTGCSSYFLNLYDMVSDGLLKVVAFDILHFSFQIGWALIGWKGKSMCFAVFQPKPASWANISTRSTFLCIQYTYSYRLHTTILLFGLFEHQSIHSCTPTAIQDLKFSLPWWVWRRWNPDTEESATLRLTHPWPANSVTIFWIKLLFSHIFP